MIIGTAGHIDHGKTALVHALTGVKGDRLPEEKKRGITMELGYAFMNVPNSHEKIGFIDVPGHEKLIHTMMSGAQGINFALLLIAADDGVMPQTKEHLAILSLLGINRGAIIITKIDKVDNARIIEIKEQIYELLKNTPLENSVIFETSSHSSAGINELKDYLINQAVNFLEYKKIEQGADKFRMPVDRVFTIDGIGTVITGTSSAGQIKVSEELVLMPPLKQTAGIERLRIKSIHAQNQSEQIALPHQRCAIALANLPKQNAQRGQWLCTPEIAQTSDRIDGVLQLWQNESQKLKSGAHIHAHIGAASEVGSIHILSLENQEVTAGQKVLAQIILQKPVCAWHGDVILLRDASAQRPIGSFKVLDAFAPKRYRQSSQRLSELAVLNQDNIEDRIRDIIKVSNNSVDLEQLQKSQGLDVKYFLQNILQDNELIISANFAITKDNAKLISDKTKNALKKFHAENPNNAGLDIAKLRRMAAPKIPVQLYKAIIDSLIQSGDVEQKGAAISEKGHISALTKVEQIIFEKAAPIIEDNAFEGAWARDIAKHINTSEPITRTALGNLCKTGQMHQVIKDLYYLEKTFDKLLFLVKEVAAENDGKIDVGHFRDKIQIGRKRVIQILEYFDKIGATRRVANSRKIRLESAWFNKN